MYQSKDKYRKNRILAVVILLITFGLIYLYYGDTYKITDDSDKLEDAVSNYIFNDNVNVEVELIQQESGWMYVVFTDRQYGNNFKGLARLKRGWNGKFVLYDANYGSGYPVSQYLFRNDNSKVAIYGLLPDDRAVRYEYVSTGSVSGWQVVYAEEISQKAFVQVCDNSNIYLMSLHLYDTTGKDITESYIKTESSNAPNAGIGTAELFMVDFVCGFILLCGSLLSISNWRKEKHEK
jgi:hypothetical protein